MKYINLTTILISFVFSACSFNNNAQVSEQNKTHTDHETPVGDYYSNLSELEEEVLYNKGTERPFSGDLLYNKDDGTYQCRGCGAAVFQSDDKFDSGTGWPSFDKAIPGAVTEVADHSYGMNRVEINCSQCGGHLGHVFDDGPTETGMRYCINSCSLDFEKEGAATKPAEYETITLGGGCFWCVEAIYDLMDGVISADSGYSGGDESTATYKQVSSGNTKHAEVVQIKYDPAKVSLSEILEVFFASHDPTTLNRQGADYGTQYRSVIFYSNDVQKKEAREIIDELTKNNIYAKPIVTEVSPYTGFYNAEQYHQDYYANNPGYGYCEAVITPKVEKFKKVFADKLKK